MKLLTLALLVAGASAFSPSSRAATSPGVFPSNENVRLGMPDDENMMDDTLLTRTEFLSTVSRAALMATALSSMPTVAAARGRATLEQAYDRYAPRIIAGGVFYGGDFRKMIGGSDWASIKRATSDPPKKSKADRTKADGGVSERAAQAGEFSDARVLVACDLFAAAFSDNSISLKTKKMQAEVVKLRQVVEGINSAAREALGEGSGGGGLFGFGGKKRSQAELSAQVKKLYVEGGNAWNQYIFAANDELPLSLDKLPYIK